MIVWGESDWQSFKQINNEEHCWYVGAGSYQLMVADEYPAFVKLYFLYQVQGHVMRSSVAWNCSGRERLHHSHWQMLWVGTWLTFLKDNYLPHTALLSHLTPWNTFTFFSKRQQSSLGWWSHRCPVGYARPSLSPITSCRPPQGPPLHRLALTAPAIALQHLYCPLFLFTVPFLFYF